MGRKKFFNFKSLFLASFLAVAGIFSAGAFVVNEQIKETPVVEKAEAANNKHFFIDCTAVGGWDSESLCIHTWNGSKDVYIEATCVADNYWYVIMDTTGCSGYRWYRCKKGNTGTRWNESGWNSNINNNYCSIKGWDSNAEWSGSTNGCEESYEVASTTPSTSTKRVWVNPKDNFYDSSARAALRVFSDSGHYKTYILGGSSQFVNMTHEGGTQYFFYVDVPVDYDCQLVRLHNAFDFVWTYSANFSTKTDWNTTLCMFSWDASASLSAGWLDDNNNYTVDFAKKYVDGYSTCLSSAVNGYGAYTNMNTNVLSKLGSTKLNSLRVATFTAPGYGTRTYGDKIDRLSNSGKPKGAIFGFQPFELIIGEDGNDNLSTIIVIIASFISLLSITALSVLMVKKRKRKEQ